MRPVLFLLGLGVLSGCNCGSIRASASPSPPLLPLPQTTQTD